MGHGGGEVQLTGFGVVRLGVEAIDRNEGIRRGVAWFGALVFG